MSSLCWECKYEHSDCKGDKWVEKAKCDYFSKKLAINYPKRIEELERKVEFFDSLYQGQLDANEKLLLRKETLEAQNKELKAELEQEAEAYDNQGRQLLEALDEIEKLKEENVDLRFESVRAFERGTKFPCNLDCDSCTEKCRAWQNGFNAKGGNNHIVQVRHINNPFSKLYTFNVPEGLGLKKDDVVLCETKGGKPSVAMCRTDSVWVEDDVLKMIVGEMKVTSWILGKYELKECDTE